LDQNPTQEPGRLHQPVYVRRNLSQESSPRLRVAETFVRLYV